ncbi:MAG: prolipoprotein diacylglyceryl transferase [Ardenticatenaceae bacterium]|nr:prolipoprotein diacylglyceryl transferase [Ardenticatenaceae bacterium]
MFPYVNIGPLAFPSTGLVILLGAWLGLSLVERTAKRLGQNQTLIYGVAATAVFLGFIGARLTYVVQRWPAFRHNLLDIIWPLNTGYVVWGGVVLGLIAAFFYARSKRLALWPTLDALAPGIVFALMMASLADFVGGPGFGSLTAVPWGISQYGVKRHPVQLYEILVGGLALLAWWRSSQRAGHIAGRPFLMATAVYSAARLFVDAFRETAWVTGEGFHILQISSLVILLAALFQIGRMTAPDTTQTHDEPSQPITNGNHHTTVAQSNDSST